jgi:hypothetical protein
VTDSSPCTGICTYLAASCVTILVRVIVQLYSRPSHEDRRNTSRVLVLMFTIIRALLRVVDAIGPESALIRTKSLGHLLGNSYLLLASGTDGYL